MSSRSSSFGQQEFSQAKILTWTKGLETFERLDFICNLMHTLYPPELRYVHGIVDGILKRDETLCASSIHQANDFARLSNFYEHHDPRFVISNDGLRRQFIVDLSTLHPLNFCCAEIFFNVLAGAEVNTWTFDLANIKILRELVLITSMIARHGAFRFDCRLCIWNSSRHLRNKLTLLKELEEDESRRERENLSSPEIISIPEALTFERESTLTATGSVVRGERLVNGFSEPSNHPRPSYQTKVTRIPPRTTQDLPLQSPTSFPPLSSPAKMPVVVPLSAPRPKTVSDAQLFEEKSGLDKENPVSVPISRRAYSMENCDTSTPDVEYDLNKPAKGRKELVTQVSEPSASGRSSSVPKNEASTQNLPATDKRPRTEARLPQAHVVSPNHSFPPSAASGGITGSFPDSYRMLPPNGVVLNPTANPRLLNQQQQKTGCYNCGQADHSGLDCPKKKQLSHQEADSYCTLRRDAKQYPQRGRRAPGSN